MESSISCTTCCKLCIHQNEALVSNCLELTLMWWVDLRWTSIACTDACHHGKAHWGLAQSMKKQSDYWNSPVVWTKKQWYGLHIFVFELNKICNGAVYTDAQHLNYLILCFLGGVANYNPIIHSTIYIAVDPWNMNTHWIRTVSCEGNLSNHNSWCDTLI